MGFADSIKKTSEKIQKEVNITINNRIIDGGNFLVNKTPVKTGLLRNNWYVGIGKNNYTKQFSNNTSVVGLDSLYRINTIGNEIEFYKKDGEISITNTTPYAYRAEIIGWPLPEWSGTVGPYAMVRNTITYMRGKYK